MATAITTAITSNRLKLRSIGCPIACPTKTKMGATSKATNKLDPIAIETERSMLFFMATVTAETYSAAPPTKGSKITPVKSGVSPNPAVASSTAPTKISDSKATPIVASTKTPIHSFRFGLCSVAWVSVECISVV